jgi:hypothetical protein
MHKAITWANVGNQCLSLGMRCPVGPQFMPNLMPTQSIVDELCGCPGQVIKAKVSSTRVRRQRVILAADLPTAPDAQTQGAIPDRSDVRQTVRQQPSARAHASVPRRALALPLTCDKAENSARQTNTHPSQNSRFQRPGLVPRHCLTSNPPPR